MANKHGGKRAGAGTRNEVTRVLYLSAESLVKLNALVARQRAVLGERISHTAVVEGLIQAAFEREIDTPVEDWQGEIV